MYIVYNTAKNFLNLQSPCSKLSVDSLGSKLDRLLMTSSYTYMHETQSLVPVFGRDFNALSIIPQSFCNVQCFHGDWSGGSVASHVTHAAMFRREFVFSNWRPSWIDQCTKIHIFAAKLAQDSEVSISKYPFKVYLVNSSDIRCSRATCERIF